jgi:fumarate hydratase subunit beta
MNLTSSRTHHITLPVEDSFVQDLRVGDLIFLTGTIVTGRDHFHQRVMQLHTQNKPLPDIFQCLKGGALYHMGPIVKEEQGEYHIISGGPTTSARMNMVQTQVCKILGVRFVIGKGGLDNIPWGEIPAAYLQYPGGAGALVSKFIHHVLSVEWLDLGSPEAAWVLEVHEFGPLVVAIDTHGGDLYHR